MDGYAEFLASKRIASQSHGIEIVRDRLHEKAFDFQQDITAWALKKGRCAAFCDTGLGKSLMELAETKMKVNYAREWGDPDKDGVRRHIG